MNTETINKPGSLVKYRERDWMVLPSEDPDLLMIKPLGGSDEEITGIFLPLNFSDEVVVHSKFEKPSVGDLGDFQTAKLLFDASRLSFRNASGPFRCFGKLSFRPRAYQIVPLVMALKQDVVRMMVADDVGIGKTIEALIILKELIERGEIKKFAVICPPHLCDQWQSELKDKLDIDAEIIRSSTAASLDRRLPDDQSIFHHVPYQVISIDYIKSDKRKNIFLNDCPELVIVDEAHTCALPEGAKSKNQQQRHSLIHEIAEDLNKHLLLLTATPHSGKDAEFISLLGLLKPDFRNLNFDTVEQKERKKIADHFIQRKRENIINWENFEKTHFPGKESREIGYNLSPSYRSFYLKVLEFARALTVGKADESEQKRMIRSWAAISLIRGVMSSPQMAMEMLKKQQEKVLEIADEDIDVPTIEMTLFDDAEVIQDKFREELLDRIELQKEQVENLHNLAEKLCRLQHDTKAHTALNIIKKWIDKGFYPIIFCKYIATANYLGELLKEAFPNSINIQVVTSELADERRKEIVAEMGESQKRLLVATDCLSEGINLQEYFTAVLHYDLPWNPNRIEQRDGRVDRFGQDAPEIKTYILYGEDNPMDKFVLEVLIKKIRNIQETIGVSIALGDETKSIMAQAADHILKGELIQKEQLALFAEEKVTNEIETAKQKAKNLRSIFAHSSVDSLEIQSNLKEVDEVIGDISTVEKFVIQSLIHLGASVVEEKEGFKVNAQNLPPHLRDPFSKSQKISFESPTPKGYKYIGRNHLFVEQLCQFMLALAFEGHSEYNEVARMSEIITEAVDIKTTLVTFRVRNVIKEVQTIKKVVAEEMYLWGYKGSLAEAEFLSYKEAKKLLLEAGSAANLSLERQQDDLNRELKQFQTLETRFIDLAKERADHLVDAHGRFKKLVGGRRYETVSPVLPPDVMGVYLLLPKPKAL